MQIDGGNVGHGLMCYIYKKQWWVDTFWMALGAGSMLAGHSANRIFLGCLFEKVHGLPEFSRSKKKVYYGR